MKYRHNSRSYAEATFLTLGITIIAAVVGMLVERYFINPVKSGNRLSNAVSAAHCPAPEVKVITRTVTVPASPLPTAASNATALQVFAACMGTGDHRGGGWLIHDCHEAAIAISQGR